MKIAALQLPTLPLSNKKLREYIQKASINGARVVVLGEYVLNNFFKELVTMQKNMIDIQTKHKIEALESFAREFEIDIVAPIIIVNNNKIYKATGHFSPNETIFRNQEFLISYNHWDEESFFDNKPNKEVSVMSFSINGLNFAVINGFEIHFDHIWLDILKKDADIVLVPSASTFGSNQRWNEILKTRAFLNSVYILRVNRIGSYQDEGSFWNFYGETYLINPDGFIEETLDSSEDILIAEVDVKELRESHGSWKFRDYLKHRDLL